MYKKYFSLILCSIALVWIGVFVFQSTQKPDFTKFHGTLLSTPREIKPFKLTGIDGQPFNKSMLQGHWSILFFGFTSCGSMCPTAMSELGKMYRQLEAQNIQPKPHVIMITIDPERDHLKKLSQYVKIFHPDFFGARAEERNLKPLTQELGIAYTTVTRKSSDQNTAYRDIEHTGAFLFFNPKGQLVAFSTPPHHADQLVEDYRLLIQ